MITKLWTRTVVCILAFVPYVCQSTSMLEDRFATKELFGWSLREKDCLRPEPEPKSAADSTTLYLAQADTQDWDIGLIDSCNLDPFLYSLHIERILIKAAQENEFSKCEALATEVNTAFLRDNGTFAVAYAKLKTHYYKDSIDYLNRLSPKNPTLTWYQSYYKAYSQAMIKNWSLARKELESLTCKTKNKETSKTYLLSHIYHNERDLQKLEESLQDLEKRYTKLDETKLQRLLLMQADLYFLKGQYADAKEAFKGLEVFLPKLDEAVKNEVFYKLGFSNYKLTEYKEALGAFERIQEKNSPLAQISYFHAGICCIHLKEYKKALKYFYISATVENDANNKLKERSYLEIAKLNYLLEDYPTAIIWLTKLQERPLPKRFGQIVRDLLENAYLQSQNLEEAIEYFEKQPSLSQRARKIYNQKILEKARKYFQEQLFKECLDFTNKYLSLEKKNFERIEEATLIKGIAFLKLSDFESARNVFKELINSKCCSTRILEFALYYLACAEFEMGNYKVAIEVLKLCKDSKNFCLEMSKSAYLKLADAYLKLNDLHEAKRIYEKEILIDSNYAQMQLGTIECQKENFEKSLMHFKNVLSSPAHEETWYSQALYYTGVANLKKMNYEEAINCFKNLETRKDYQDYFVNAKFLLALAHTSLKEYTKAEEAYLILLNSPDKDDILTDILDALKALYVEQKKETEFLDFLSNSEFSKKDGGKYYLAAQRDLVKALFYAQRHEDLTSFIQNFEAREKKITDEEILFYFGESLEIMGDSDKSLEIFEKLVKNTESKFFTRALQRIASIHYKRCNYDEALSATERLFTSLTDLHKKESTLLLILALCEKLGNSEKVSKYSSIILKGKFSIETKIAAVIAMAKIKIMQKEFAETLELLTKLEAPKNSASAAEVEFLIAKVYYAEEKYVQAIEKIYSLVKEYRTHAAIVEDSFLLLVDIFIAQAELGKAKATLSSLIKNSSNLDKKEQAQIKLSQIERLV